MIKLNYAKDNAIIRSHLKQKKYKKESDEKKLIKDINKQTKKSLKYSVNRLIKENYEDNDQSMLRGSYHNKLINTQSFPLSKLMRPIEINSDEYEKAIKSYLGIEVIKDQKKNVDVIRSKSTIKLKQLNKSWAEKIKKIEEQEEVIKENIKKLDLKKQSINKLPILTNSLNKTNEKQEVFKSLHQPNQILAKVLKNIKKNKK